MRSEEPFDIVQRPRHYNIHPSGVEVIEITENMVHPNLANCWKYLARHEHKGNPIQDLDKAKWYLEREVQRREDWAYKRPGMRVVVEVAPGFVEVYLPFYRYISAERDAPLRETLINVWDLDKVSNIEVNWYSSALAFIAERRNRLRREADEFAAQEAATRAAEEEAHRRNVFYEAAAQADLEVSQDEADAVLYHNGGGHTSGIQPAEQPSLAEYVSKEFIPGVYGTEHAETLPNDIDETGTDEDVVDGGVGIGEPVEFELGAPLGARQITARGLAHQGDHREGDEIMAPSGNWEKIERIRRTRGGIVWVKTKGRREELRYKPKQNIMIRRGTDA